MTRCIFFPFQYLSRKIQTTYAVIDFFQRQGLGCTMHSIVAVQSYQCVLNWLFCVFSWPKNREKIRRRCNYDNDKSKIHVKKYEQCRVESCQQDFRLAKMYLPLNLYYSLNVRQLKDLILPLHLQELAKYRHLMH